MFTKSRTSIVTIFALLFLVAGFVQAQPTLISGTVTHDGNPVKDFHFIVTNPNISIKNIVHTNEHGYYVTQALVGTNTITAVDTFSYNPVSAEIEIATPGQNITQDFELTLRTDLVNVSGSVLFEGNAVETDVFFLKVGDDTNLDDFRQVEGHFNIPTMATRWASYHALTDDKGVFALGMLTGKYVMYIPAGDLSLAYWGSFEVTGPMTLDPIHLQKMTTISGLVGNMDDYDHVMVYAHSMDAGRPYMALPDENSNYIINVAPGTYVVRVVAFFDEYMYSEFYTGTEEKAYVPKDAMQLEVGADGYGGVNFMLPVAAVYDFTIKGMVTSNQSGLPIQEAGLQFMSTNFTANLWNSYDAMTDENGMYEINGKTILKVDSLIGFAWAENFFSEFYDNKATFLTADPIVYTADGVVENINFALDTLDTENNFSISGMVYDDQGNALTSGIVSAYTTATNVGQITVQVDSMGHYMFDPVFPTGSTVFVQAWSWGYLPELYNEAESWKDADAITIGSEDVSGIDFTLTEVAPARLALGTIKGLVSLPGSSMAKMSAKNEFVGATAFVRAEGTSKWTAVDFIAEDGSFELPVEKNGNYELKISANGHDDAVVLVTVDNLSGTANITLEPTDIKISDDYIITSHVLHDAYPNPFNPSTTIQVEMAKSTQASLIVYNVIGQKVKTLHNGILSQGMTKFTWNGNDDASRAVASGLYFYQLKTQNTVNTKAVMFIK